MLPPLQEPTSAMSMSDALRRWPSRLGLAGWAGVLLLAACAAQQGSAEPSVPPTPGLEFRSAPRAPCLPCAELPRAAPQTTLHLQRRPLLTSADIAGVAKAWDPISGLPALQFTFRKDAQERILAITAQ